MPDLLSEDRTVREPAPIPPEYGEPAIVLIHGLPGVGKTTLCRRLGACPAFCYVDLGMQPDFKSARMVDVCAREYRAHAGGRHLLTEGVLSNRRGRDRFVEGVMSLCRLSRGLIVYLCEDDPEFMARRRRRSAEDYRVLMNAVEVGSDKFDYAVYQSSPDERSALPERARRIARVLGERLRCSTISSWAEAQDGA